MPAESSTRAPYLSAADVRARSTVLWVGDASLSEFAACQAWLQSHANCTAAPNGTAAVESLAPVDAAPPTVGWIVLAGARPGCWPPEEIARLRDAAPLARIVLLLGPWCEGELAKRAPTAGVQRVAWHQFTARFAAWTRRGASEGPAAWPLTASEEEKLTRSVRVDAAHVRTRSGTVVAVRRETRAVLKDALTALGHRGLDAADAGDAEFILWHAPQASASALDGLRDLQARWPAGRIIACVDFLRPHEVTALRQAGAAAVVSRPFSLNELAAAIDAV